MSLSIDTAASAFFNPFANSRQATASASAQPISTSSTDADPALPSSGLDSAQQAAVQKLYNAAAGSVAAGQAKSFLLNLSPEQLSLLQEAHGLVNPVNAGQVSEEGAENLLLSPSHYVDSNNDGVVDVGATHLSIFPPLNAPQAVKDAWTATTKGLSQDDIIRSAGLFLGVSPLLSGRVDPTLSKESSPNFDWTNYIDQLQNSNDLNRPLNSPQTSDQIAALLTKFKSELQSRGVT
jgi:hypothetical protein